jgi:putative peptidoglycan lipid II flippase
MLQNLRNIAVISLSTVGSRFLGLVRDILIFAALGTSIWNSAFILAFTLPNLFRRLLGEGALTSAVVPVFTDVLKSQGREAAFLFFNQVLLRVSALLLATVTGGVVVLALLNNLGLLSGRWILGADLSVVLLPYMIFICLAAVVSAGLNVIGRFAAAALTPVLLNLSMIAALVAGWCLGSGQKELVYLLCGGVLFGGLLQLALPTWDLIRQGWRPRLSRESSAPLEQVWSLFLPGLMGAAILQVNILVSRLLAFSLDESSVSVLYLASRLMELPLGVFTISVATVFFPLLAAAVSDRDKWGFAQAFNQGVRLILAISIPAGLGLLLLAEPILALLFNWGNFSAGDVQATQPLLIIYALGLPFYSLATFATRGLHAQKDMISPVRVAGLCLSINAVAGYLLMQFFGAAGLAAANIIAAAVQAALLWKRLAYAVEGVRARNLLRPSLQIALGALGMGAVIGGLLLGFHELGPAEDEKLSFASLVGLAVPLGVLVYFGLLNLLGFEDIGELKNLLLRKKKLGKRVTL